MSRPGTVGHVRRLVAVILVMAATAAALVGTTPPANAAACGSSSGVSVVVDFTGITSGMRSACVAGGADQPADNVLTAAGFALTWVSRQPGFLCRVDGVPAADPCVNTPPSTAYWGLFWSDGKDGIWHYSDFGVTGLQVPDGGYIGLAWQGGSRHEPAEAPAAHASSTPAPSSTPTAAPTTGGAGSTPTSPSTTGAPATRTPKPTRSTTPQPSNTGGTGAPAATTTPTPTTPTVPTDSTSDTPGDAAAGPTGSQGPSSSVSASKSPSPSDVESAVPQSDTSSPVAAASPSKGVELNDSEVRTSPETDSGRVPTGLSLGILVVLLGVIGALAWAARRRTPH